MYCDYYGFRHKPFNLTPDPDFIFLSEHHREAFAHLLYGIDNHSGFIALTGEVGTGKTTVIRTLLSQLSGDKYRTAIILNPCISSLGLMQHINREYGISADHSDSTEHLHQLNQFLLQENEAGRTVVLVVDEAQNLEAPVLEQIRLLSNLETERDKLIQIVLVGQPELRDLLDRPDLRQLRQRIAVNYHLHPMNFSDTRDYILHRLHMAGRKDNGIFSAGAVKTIFRFSGGVPRLINLVCDRALLLGFTKERTPISSSMATVAISDIRRSELKQSRLRVLMWPAVICCTLIVCAILYAVMVQHPAGKAAPQVAALPAPDFRETAVSELGKSSEVASAGSAFNELSLLWKKDPIQNLPSNFAPEGIARQWGMECYRYTGNLGALLRMKTPAVLELTLPGISGKRYLTMTGGEDGKIAIAPPLASRTILTAAELEGIWTGSAYLFWKNYLEIPVNLKSGVRKEAVGRLQGLLRAAGAYDGPLNSVLDQRTAAAIRSFQHAHSVNESQLPGRKTLLLLYLNSGSFHPLLAEQKEKSP